MVRLASIHVYPRKAARAVDLGESLVEPWGMAGDRRWLLTDPDGRFLTQREEPSLARVVVRYGPAAGTMSVSADGLAICAVTTALLRRRTDTRAPAPVRPGQHPPADPGMIRSPSPRPGACSPTRRHLAPPRTGSPGQVRGGGQPLINTVRGHPVDG